MKNFFIAATNGRAISPGSFIEAETKDEAFKNFIENNTLCKRFVQWHPTEINFTRRPPLSSNKQERKRIEGKKALHAKVPVQSGRSVGPKISQQLKKNVDEIKAAKLMREENYKGRD